MPKISGGFTSKRPERKQGWVPCIKDTKNGKIVNRQMRRHQERVYNRFIKSFKNIIIQHPGGSGKSTLVLFMFAKIIAEQLNRKLLIVIPQQMISKTFLPSPGEKLFLQYPDGTKIEWTVGLNLCEKTPNGKNAELIDWMLQSKFPKGDYNRIAITTYQALVLAWGQLKKEEKKVAILNTSFAMDEAHRIFYQENDREDDEENDDLTTNKVGDFIKFATNKKNKTTNLCLTTATYIRGDKAAILPDEIYDQFEVDFLPLDDYWADIIENIESFEYDFYVYKANPFREVRTVLENNKKKTIIYCPGQGSKHGCKYTFLENLQTEIHKVWPDANILDFVNEVGRDKRKEDFITGNIKPDIILAVDLMNEGVDWVECEQILDIAPTNSLTRQLQRILRLWRDFDGKRHIVYHMFLQFNKKALNEEKYRYELNKIISSWTAGMLIQEIIQPLNIKKLDGEKKKSVKRTVFQENPFQIAFPDWNLQNTILDEVVENLVRLRSVNGKNPSLNETRESIESIVVDFGIEENVEEIVNCIAAMLRRRYEPNYGIDVSFVVDAGFELIWKNEIYDDILSFGSFAAGIKTFKEFREFYGEKRTVDEWVLIAEKLAEENGWDGKLTDGIKGFTEEEIAEMRAEYDAQES